MLFSTASVVVWLGAFASAVTATKSTSYTAKFDDRTASGVPALNPVGVYNGILYKAFAISSKATGLGGVRPQSGANVAITTLLQNQAREGTPTLTVDYPGSTGISITLYSFYFGFVAPTVASVVGAAIQGTVLAACFNDKNKQIAVATYTFTPPPTNLVNAPLIQAVLPSSFTGCHNITIVQTSPATQVLAIDDVVYKVLSSY